MKCEGKSEYEYMANAINAATIGKQALILFIYVIFKSTKISFLKGSTLRETEHQVYQNDAKTSASKINPLGNQTVKLAAQGLTIDNAIRRLQWHTENSSNAAHLYRIVLKYSSNAKEAEKRLLSS